MPLFDVLCLDWRRETSGGAGDRRERRPALRGLREQPGQAAPLGPIPASPERPETALPGPGDTACCGTSPDRASCAGPGSCCGEEGPSEPRLRSTTAPVLGGVR